MKLNEKIHISLAIDSDNNTSFDLDPNEDLDILCPNIVKKFNLSQKVEKNLKKYIENFISEELKKEKEKKKLQQQKANASVSRLYYQSIVELKKKKECLKKLKEEKFNKFVDNFTFKPKILFYKANHERNYVKIEDKLIEDGKIKNEKQALKRIRNDIENRQNKNKNTNLGNSSLQQKSIYSSIINDEKKYINQDNPINNVNTPKSKSNLIFGFTNCVNNINLSNNIHNNSSQFHNSNGPNQTNIIQNSSGNYNSGNSNNPNYQIFIFDENNKGKTQENAVNSKIKNQTIPNLNLNTNNLKSSNTNLNNSNMKSSSKILVNLNTKTLDNSLPKLENQLLVNKISNIAGNTNHILNNLQYSSQSNKKYADQYLKQHGKNNPENIYNLSHQSSVSQKKNDSLNSQSENYNNNHHKNTEITKNEDLAGNKHSTTNQIIQNYNSARKFNQSISFKNESNRLMSKKKDNEIDRINNQSKEKIIYNKKIIPNKKSKIFNKKLIDCREKENINYRFKIVIEKEKDDKDYFNTIYEHSKLHRKAKEDHYSHIKSLEHSFKPILKVGSKKFISKSFSKIEKKEDFYKRLTNSKKLKNLSVNLDIRNKSLQKFSFTPNNNKNKEKRSFSNKSNCTNKIVMTTEETDLKSYKNTLTGGTIERDVESSRMREVKQSRELSENIKMQQVKEKKMFNNCTEKILDNINKFKLNNLKEIFEIIYNNCTNIDDIQNIENYGINSKIKDKLILPTCHIMKERNLEFNFQNFFLISNEIINFTIDV